MAMMSISGGVVVIGRHWGNTGPITQDSVDR